MLPVIYKLDKDRTLKLNFKSVARLEKIFEKKIDDWNIQKFSIDETITILTESMRSEDPDITVEKVKDLIDDYSTVREAYKIYNKCLESFFGKNEEPAAVNSQATPPESEKQTQQENGTGA